MSATIVARHGSHVVVELSDCFTIVVDRGDGTFATNLRARDAGGAVRFGKLADVARHAADDALPGRAASYTSKDGAERALRRRSGTNIPEAQRGTVAVKLRLSPESAAVLRERAETAGETVSATVERLLVG